MVANIKFAIFPGGKKLWVRYCHCGALIGAVGPLKCKPWKIGKPSKKHLQVLSSLVCSRCNEKESS